MTSLYFVNVNNILIVKPSLFQSTALRMSCQRSRIKMCCIKLQYLNIVTLLFLLTLSYTVKGDCKDSELVAEMYTNVVSTKTYGGKLKCEWEIKPWESLEHDEYLELRWSDFKVNAAMPDCSGDNVEVFVTKSEHSLGKFCSNNKQIYTPFTMVSFDGYAKIKFSLDTSSGARIALKYQIKRSPRYEYCSGTFVSSTRAVALLKTPYWPSERRYKTCEYNIYSGYNEVIRIIFMNFDLGGTSTSCGSHYVKVKVKDSVTREESVLLNACNRRLPFHLETTKNKMQVSYSFMDGHIGRGFAAGVIKYKKNIVEAKKPSKLWIAATVTALIGLLGVFVGIILYRVLKKRNAVQLGNVNTQPNTTTGTQPTVHPFLYPSAPGHNMPLGPPPGDKPPGYFDVVSAPDYQPHFAQSPSFAGSAYPGVIGLPGQYPQTNVAPPPYTENNPNAGTSVPSTTTEPSTPAAVNSQDTNTPA